MHSFHILRQIKFTDANGALRTNIDGNNYFSTAQDSNAAKGNMLEKIAQVLVNMTLQIILALKYEAKNIHHVTPS